MSASFLPSIETDQVHVDAEAGKVRSPARLDTLPEELAEKVVEEVRGWTTLAKTEDGIDERRRRVMSSSREPKFLLSAPHSFLLDIFPV